MLRVFNNSVFKMTCVVNQVHTVSTNWLFYIRYYLFFLRPGINVV